MNQMLNTFLSSVTTNENRSIVESIRLGYSLIFESAFNGKELIVVDIQPEYEKSFRFKPYQFTEFLNQHATEFSSITLLYNGPDLGMVSESEYAMWLVENGLEEDVLSSIKFFEKGYAFFRNVMDAGVDHDEIVHVIAFMAKNDINDSRDLSEELWNEFSASFPNDSDIIEYLKDNEDAIFIPELINELDNSTQTPLVMGGGKDECLAEVLIVLKYLGRNYSLINQFVY